MMGDLMPKETDLFVEGEVLFGNGQYRKVISKFNQILNLVKDNNNHSTVVNTHTMLGECYYRLENFDEAMRNFDKVRSLAESRQDRYSLAISQVNLSKVLGQYIRQGDSTSAAQALYYLEEARQLFMERIVGILFY